MLLKTSRGRNLIDDCIDVGLILNLSVPCVLNIIPLSVKLLFIIKSLSSVAELGVPKPIEPWTASFSFENNIWQLASSADVLSVSLFIITLQLPLLPPPDEKI